MRKKIKIKEIKEVDTIISKEFCDWCGKEIIDKTRGYEVDDFELKHSFGNFYPEGDCCKQKHVELCMECIPKFFELLIKNGIRINEIDREDYYDNEVIE